VPRSGAVFSAPRLGTGQCRLNAGENVRFGSNSAVQWPAARPRSPDRRVAFLLQQLGHFCFNGRPLNRDGSRATRRARAAAYGLLTDLGSIGMSSSPSALQLFCFAYQNNPRNSAIDFYLALPVISYGAKATEESLRQVWQVNGRRPCYRASSRMRSSRPLNPRSKAELCDTP
jgi:hypothetical protein